MPRSVRWDCDFHSLVTGLRSTLTKSELTRSAGWNLLAKVRSLLDPGPEAGALRQRIDSLRNRHTGGLVTFFDAVPGAQERDLLETDLLNPHYPDFYKDPARGRVRFPPSDDQNPNPVSFLAVRSGAVFEFPYRVAEWPQAEPRDEPERQRSTREQVIEEVRSWLTDALTTWGAGAKTAAGYGYFEIVKS